MSRYRKKPVTVEAERWDGSEESIAAICRWANEGQDEPIVTYLTHTNAPGPYAAQVFTLNGPVALEPGEYVVKGVQGEFYPCKADIFEQTHREAGDHATVAETWTEPSGQEPPPAGSVEACQYRSLIALEVCAMTPNEAENMVAQASRVLSAHLGARGFVFAGEVVFHKRGCK